MRERVRKFAYGIVGVSKCFCTAIVIYLAVKRSCSSNRIEMLLLSIRTILYLNICLTWGLPNLGAAAPQLIASYDYRYKVYREWDPTRVKSE